MKEQLLQISLVVLAERIIHGHRKLKIYYIINLIYQVLDLIN